MAVGGQKQSRVKWIQKYTQCRGCEFGISALNMWWCRSTFILFQTCWREQTLCKWRLNTKYIRFLVYPQRSFSPFFLTSYFRSLCFSVLFVEMFYPVSVIKLTFVTRFLSYLFSYLRLLFSLFVILYFVLALLCFISYCVIYFVE